MSHQAVIAVSVAPIYKKPVFSSEMLTQALMWENVKILKTQNNWNFTKIL